ncbi:MAG TPA: 3-hydroxyacyl-CoA dehydrogenase NAD-binding domain-containing protein, partial [Candidatus Ozemobacteraceae bacterium]|nr:3-hydroxyacyl-CoA dehydrogenase NAD-binding domain-containing protein [Candidatus Ozemobacteraceae bacterium]
MSQKRMIVVGAGNLGRRLAQALATSGFEVLVIDESEELNKQAQQQIEHSIDGEIARWGLTSGDKRAILARLQFSTKLSEAPDGGAVFEAISENLELKIALFKQLD